MLKNLLNKSHDLLVVFDTTGTFIESGKHLKQIIARAGHSEQEFAQSLASDLPEILQGSQITLPLTGDTIPCSPFSLLYKNDEHIVLIAEDLSAQAEISDLTNENRWLSEKDIRIHTLLDESSDPIFGFERDGTYIYVNNVFARTMGYEKEEIIGKRIWDIFSQEEADKRFAMVRKVFTTGETDNIEVRIPLPQGGEKHFLTTVKPVKAEDNNVSYIICISKDITELRQTQNQLSTLHGILPICSSCKNIRNDKGAWQKVEEYITNHSEAVFSHGICPDCIDKLYPDIFD